MTQRNSAAPRGHYPSHRVDGRHHERPNRASRIAPIVDGLVKHATAKQQKIDGTGRSLTVVGLYQAHEVSALSNKLTSDKSVPAFWAVELVRWLAQNPRAHLRHEREVWSLPSTQGQVLVTLEAHSTGVEELFRTAGRQSVSAVSDDDRHARRILDEAIENVAAMLARNSEGGHHDNGQRASTLVGLFHDAHDEEYARHRPRRSGTDVFHAPRPVR